MLRFRLLNSSSTRATLMPPPVDPAQAPTTIRQSRMVLEKLGHRSKSVEAKPVVEMTDAKTLGEHTASVRLHKEVVATVNFNVVVEEA